MQNEVTMESKALQGATAGFSRKPASHPLDGVGRGAKLNAIINHIKDLEGRVSNLQIENINLKSASKTMQEHTMQVFTFLADTQAQIEALRVLLTTPRRFSSLKKMPVFQDEDFERTWDTIKEIRTRGPDEFIAKGDFVRISYEAYDGEKLIHTEKDFGIRVGSNVMFIEDEIIGKPVNLKAHRFVKTYPEVHEPNPDLAGKTVTFVLNVDKVKTQTGDGGYRGVN